MTAIYVARHSAQDLGLAKAMRTGAPVRASADSQQPLVMRVLKRHWTPQSDNVRYTTAA